MSENKKKKNTEQLSIEKTEPKEEVINNLSLEENKRNFEEQSPLLNEDVIERKNDLVLEAQPVEPPKQEEKPAFTSFGKPTLNTAPTESKQEVETISAQDPVIVQEEQKEKQPPVPPAEETITTQADDLPKMKVENAQNPEQEQSLPGIQKKAGQSTAKWSWTLFENAGPKLQMFFSEMDESEIRKFVLEDLLPGEAIDFAKDYNKSLESEFEIKDWEKELIYPPLEEMLEQAGMNASMSPGARFGVGISVVLGARALQTKKYRNERDELVQRLINSYAKSKGEEVKTVNPDPLKEQAN